MTGRLQQARLAQAGEFAGRILKHQPAGAAGAGEDRLQRRLRGREFLQRAPRIAGFAANARRQAHPALPEPPLQCVGVGALVRDVAHGDEHRAGGAVAERRVHLFDGRLAVERLLAEGEDAEQAAEQQQDQEHAVFGVQALQEALHGRAGSFRASAWR